MELNDYLSSLNDSLARQMAEINARENEILNKIYNSSSSAGSTMPETEVPAEPEVKVSLPRLIHDERLEDTSKSKLGTFEKIYSEIFVEEAGAPMYTYGYDDLDFSPLVNPLMTLIEIELNHSIYQEIRRQNGIDLSKYYYKNAPDKEVRFGNIVVNVGARKQMLGTLQVMINVCGQKLQEHIKDCASFCRDLSKAISVRNGASHDSFINKDRFLSFYSSYSQMYNGNIQSLMSLKKNLAGSRQDRKYLYSYGNEEFSLNEIKKRDSYILSLLEDIETDEPAGRIGIMMTDCERLSVKYAGDTRSAEELRCFFEEYLIPSYAKAGIQYMLLDISESSKGYIEDSKDWQGYHKALYGFCRERGIRMNGPLGLFIIGGDDVIPMPKVANPAHEKGFRVLEETIDADILYCYDSDFVRVFGGNRLEIGHFLNNINKPSFHVGRLPLENGMMVTSFYDDIMGYLKRALKAHNDSGIKIKSPLMTTCHRGQKCGKMMVEGLPVRELPERENAFIDNMAVSPLLMLNEEKKETIDSNIIKNMTKSEEAIDQAMEEYKEVIDSSDMLIFFLHGGYNPSSPVYYGDAILNNDTEKERIMPAVFSPELIAKDSSIKSIAGVCCYGARFIDYARCDSTLLTAIHKDTLLFYGSSRIAYGPFDDILDNVGGKLCLALGQMREYLKLLFAGVPAGEAITRAKVKFLAGCDDVDECVKTTILEFNLFGDPLLYMQPMVRLTKEDAPRNIPVYVHNERDDRTYQDVYNADAKEQSRSLLERIRGMVDRNLEGIHKQISEQLYRQYSLKPRDLFTVKRFKDGNGKEGYSYCYKHSTESVDAYTFVETDTQGIVKSIKETI